MKEGNGRMSAMEKEGRTTKTEERTEKSHRKGQEYLDSMCGEVREFQRTGRYDECT
jgi:hypothetical protein